MPSPWARRLAEENPRIDAHGNRIPDGDAECLCGHDITDHTPDRANDYSESALCEACEEQGWECDFFVLRWREPDPARKPCREHATIGCPCEGPIADND